MTEPEEDEPTEWPVEALTGIDKQIFGLLRRVVEMGEYRGTWGELDVVRVASLLCGGKMVIRGELADARKRIRALEADNAWLRGQMERLESGEPLEDPEEEAKVIIVTPLRAKVVRQAMAGQSPVQIAQSMGMKRDAAARHIERTAKQIGARTWAEGLSMIASGKVMMVVKIGGRRK